MALAVIAGAGGGCGASHPRSTAADPRPSHCFRATGHREIAGQLVDIPPGLPAHPPLVVAFHGSHQIPTWLAGESGFDDVAAKHHFVVLYPSGLVASSWMLNHASGDGDIRHIRTVIDAVLKRTCADPSRVYLTGFSMGGSFAFRVGCELADKVAAIAPVSGSYKSQDPCPRGTPPMPTLEIHGRDPWTWTVALLVAATRARNGCERQPRTHHVAPGITRTIWPGCNLQRIYNRTIGHEWLTLGPYNTSVEVWRFVSRFRRT